MIKDVFFVEDNSHLPDRSMLNESGISVYIDTTAADPFFHICMPFKNVQYISREKKCVMFMAEGREKSTSVYYG